jgi:hypothetical protein
VARVIAVLARDAGAGQRAHSGLVMGSCSRAFGEFRWRSRALIRISSDTTAQRERVAKCVRVFRVVTGRSVIATMEAEPSQVKALI